MKDATPGLPVGRTTYRRRHTAYPESTLQVRTALYSSEFLQFSSGHFRGFAMVCVVTRRLQTKPANHANLDLSKLSLRGLSNKAHVIPVEKLRSARCQGDVGSVKPMVYPADANYLRRA